jgi:hypothetical protein
VGTRLPVGDVARTPAPQEAPGPAPRRLESLFVVVPESNAGWVPHAGGYVQCLKCGSAAPSAMPRRLFYWSGCACGNIRWRWVLFFGRAFVANPEAVVPVKLVAKG